MSKPEQHPGRRAADVAMERRIAELNEIEAIITRSRASLPVAAVPDAYARLLRAAQKYFDAYDAKFRSFHWAIEESLRMSELRAAVATIEEEWK